MDTNFKFLEKLPSLPPDQLEEILEGPALSPPPNIASDFDDPLNNNTLASSVIICCLVVTTAATSLRAYAKIIVARKAHLEDALGLVMAVIFDSYAYRLLRRTALDCVDENKTIAVWTGFYAVAIMSLKAAILLEWVRLFASHGMQRTFYWTCHTFIWANVFFYTSALMAGNVFCLPGEEAREPKYPSSM
ncbi:hypothetical protein M426DRAFT_13799 [Hypoxylon sp. CI-4A]|nr:hypothetical protein M426DRAFT_13799 [Hypoxylon sp. CI-4A]